MTLFVNDADFQLYVGDVREQLRELPDESVHCVVTSPPYWGLRDYGTGVWDGGDPDCDHAGPPRASDKTGLSHRDERPPGQVLEQPSRLMATPYRDVCGKCGATRVDQQLGLEATPELFVQNMVDVFREVRRVLRRDGTCWVNLGDSYAHSLRQSGAAHAGRMTQGSKGTITSGFKPLPAGLKEKDLVGIPWRVAFALQADGWYLRSDIVWSKPNPMPESVTDRPTKAHEYVFLLTRSPRYFFDQEAVREPLRPISRYFMNEQVDGPANDTPWNNNRSGFGIAVNPAGRNVRSVWEIATQPYPEAHFATFPEALPERCIKAGSSERGCCPVCGAPWERVTESQRNGRDWNANNRAGGDRMKVGQSASESMPSDYAPPKTIGWAPSCDHDREPVPCTVLDPFMGSGTTAHVARRLGRHSIGVELNPDYAALCARRLQQLSLFAGTDA
jgi:DNA modification methylase